MNEILDFREHIFLLDKLPEFYKTLSSEYSNDFHFTNDDSCIRKPKNNFILVKDIPRYVNIEGKYLPKNIKLITVEQYSGFLINFKSVDSVDTYLKSRFGNTSRYKLRRSIKKLEACFDISYKMYFGDISKKEYDFVFEEFFRLLQLRSIEKGILDNRNIKRKNYYYKLVYPLILKKKASFFIIYNGSNPIDICLNFHVNNIVYQLIRTYDINYSKFNTGYIDLIKQIEWCINNNISFINFSYGDFYWKRRWCNTIYKYDYNIFYNSKSIKSTAKTFIYVTKIKIKHVLREKGLMAKYHEMKRKINNIFNSAKKLEIETHIIDFKKEVNVETEIYFYKANYNFLKRSIYEFLFNFNEKEKDIKIYNLMNNSNEYLIVGKENKIIIKTKSK